MLFVHTKEELTEKLEGDIHRFIRPPSEIPAGGSYFKQLFVMTSVKKELDAMPLHDMQIEILMGQEDVLQSAYEHWKRLDPQECGFDKDNFCELTCDFLKDEDYRYRGTLLYDKARTEYQSFMSELSKQEPRQIIEAAYETTVKGDILLLLEESELTPRQIDILLAMEHPLDNIYRNCLDNESFYMDLLRDTMISSIDEYGKELERHSPDQDKQIPGYMEDECEGCTTDQEPEDAEELER